MMTKKESVVLKMRKCNSSKHSIKYNEGIIYQNRVSTGGEDQTVCFAGTFNKLIEKLNGIHPDGRVLYITEGTCSLKLPIVVREEAIQAHIPSSSHLSQHRYASLEAKQEDTIDPQILMRERDRLLIQLKLLENKAKILRNRNHLLAYCKAANIVRLLRDLADDYFKEHKIDYKTYKEKSLDIINEERPELDKHRGYKQILGSL